MKTFKRLFSSAIFAAKKNEFIERNCYKYYDYYFFFYIKKIKKIRYAPNEKNKKIVLTLQQKFCLSRAFLVEFSKEKGTKENGHTYQKSILSRVPLNKSKGHIIC